MVIEEELERIKVLRGWIEEIKSAIEEREDTLLAYEEEIKGLIE